MKNHYRVSFAVMLAALFLPANLHATVRTVTFTCCSYTPANFNATVGDTVQWLGSFASHPLSSTSVPPGAAPFSNNSGSSFSYVIQIAGTYNYQCDFHAPSMAGSFTASITGVENELTTTALIPQLLPNYPNPFNPTTHIGYTVRVAGFTSLNVYDIAGNEVATLVKEKREPGRYTIEFDGSGLPSGMYFYRLQTGNFSATRKLLLLK